jgi:hypothetical protein
VSGPNPFALLSLIAAPAVLTNAASVLALSTSNRFLRASERMRALAVRTEERKHSPELQALFIRQANRTERQAVMLLAGLRAAYVGIGSFATASLISILGAGLAATKFESGFHALATVALVVGFVGAGGLVWACVRLLGATRISMQNMAEEAALIRSREQTTSAPV